MVISNNGPATLSQLIEILQALPEDKRPRIISEPVSPEISVANLAPDLMTAQPLNMYDAGEIEVLFPVLPNRAAIENVQMRLGLKVRPALVNPEIPGIFDEVVGLARSMRGDSQGFIQSVLEVASRVNASDVRLGVGDLPIVKVGGVGWRRLTEFPIVTDAQITEAAEWAAGRTLDPKNKNDFDVDAAAVFHGSAGTYRLRVNVYREKKHWATSFRFIPEDPIPFADLGLPEQIASLADLERGLVLVTGGTGSGKSTTLASIIDIINSKYAKAIQTIENPVEFVHKPRKSSIHQREIGTDTESFQSAMTSALRQNPDVILVGEIRDYEEISTAITLAETGHLVFATLHTNSAAQTISRVVDAFPSDAQNQIRTQLGMTLKAVVCQTLFKRMDDPNKGAVGTEIMFVNDSISTLIRRGDTEKLGSYILDGREEGMLHMDECLADLVRAGRISEQDALPRVSRQETYDRRMRQL